MRALYLETLRMLLNTVVCLLIFGAGLELDSSLNKEFDIYKNKCYSFLIITI